MTREELIYELKNRIGFETDYESYAMSKSEREFYTDILKMLEQEPCGNCINRAKAIENIKHAQLNFSVKSEIDFTKYKREVQEIADGILNAQIKALSELPSVQPKADWIPVSERLPEERSVWKNVTVIDESGDSPFVYVSVGFYLNDGCWIVDNEPMEGDALIRVIAWMPLPEPYSESEE